MWTCLHCERWTRDGCELGRGIFPSGGPGWCQDFSREPGSDDDMGARPQERALEAIQGRGPVGD
jgi:hypothetical protein